MGVWDDPIKVETFMVSINNTYHNGEAQILTRMDRENQALLNQAAEAAGMSLAKFTRAVLISASKSYLKEMGIATK